MRRFARAVWSSERGDEMAPSIEESRLAREVDVLAAKLGSEFKFDPTWRHVARYILASRKERERPLLIAVRGHAPSCASCRTALAAHVRLDAPPEPTLVEAVEAMRRDTQLEDDPSPRTQRVSDRLLRDAFAALAREKERGK